MNWEFVINAHLAAAALMQVLCLVFIILPAIQNKTDSKKQLAGIFFFLGWLTSLVIFGINYYLAQAPPFGNMFHVMCFMLMTLLPIYLYVSRVQKRNWLLGYFAAAALITIVGAFFMDFNAHWSQMPALQSLWFVPHVSSYMLSYSLATVGTILTLVSYFTKSGEKKYTEAAFGMILLAYPFMTFGLWSGALWADEAWGGYWSWDPKEVWSLITWGIYMIYFHIRNIAPWKRYQRPVLFIAYAALITTFLLVNKLSAFTSSIHSYAN